MTQPRDETAPEAAVFEPRHKSVQRRLVEAAVSIGVLAVLFLLVIPKVTGSTYHGVAHHLHQLSIAHIAILFGVWALGLLAYAGVLMAVLPGLKRSQGVVLNTATSAVSNVVPFGGAVGVGATYGMCRSWGFNVPDTTLAVLVSGIWNVFLKLGLPVVALVLLVAEGRASGGLAGAALVGLAALAGAVLILTLVLRSDPLAGAIGRGMQRVVSFGLRLVHRPDRRGLEAGMVRFRHHSRDLIAAKWRQLTFWMLAYSLLQFALQFLCLKLLGEHHLATIQVFAAFAFGRLLSTIPITPSGVGFADAGVASALIAFGGNQDVCLAGVFLFTGFTFLLEIPVGAVSWIVWARMTSWRHPVNEAGSHPSPTAS